MSASEPGRSGSANGTPNTAAPNGSASNGAAPNGSARNGSARNGSRRNGARGNGSRGNGLPRSARYSAISLLRRGLRSSPDWPRAWHTHELRDSYDV
ncbi:MAG: hypothetical protein QOE32_5428, partial [Pseudonocardiales bacterium]|nr:hypothetical protein [Pseudonocardiales bacterium]